MLPSFFTMSYLARVTQDSQVLSVNQVFTYCYLIEHLLIGFSVLSFGDECKVYYTRVFCINHRYGFKIISLNVKSN